MQKTTILSVDPLVRGQEIRLECLKIANAAGPMLGLNGSHIGLATQFEAWVTGGEQPAPAQPVKVEHGAALDDGDGDGPADRAADVIEVIEPPAKSGTPSSMRQGNGKK